jgi:hypothetical protein
MPRQSAPDVLRMITSYTPTQQGCGQEHLSCGHAGKHSRIALIEHRIRGQRGRVCRRCTHQASQTTQAAICATKVRYSSHSSAMHAAQAAQLHTYPCPTCQGWHLTHTP